MASTPTFRSYQKQPLNTTDVLVKLRAQGLGIANTTDAAKFLDRVGYFRFRGYLYPYLDLVNVPAAPAPKNFKPGSTFEQALQMYRFDDGLRQLIFKRLPALEVALRVALDSTICIAAGHGFWHLQPAWFKKNQHPTGVINALSASFCKSSEAYAKHYRDTYYNEQSGPYKHLPPFWVLSELSTLGQIKEMYESLREDAPGFPATTLPKNTALDKMAQQRFGAAHYRDLAKWVHMLRDVRNICAHHGRLWNKNLIAPPGLAAKVSKPFPVQFPGSATVKTNTVYAALVVMRVMSKALGIDDGIRTELQGLFATHAEAHHPAHLHAMGMPQDWDQDTVWN
jgi:abortive infection bacteriophage resistance protein